MRDPRLWLLLTVLTLLWFAPLGGRALIHPDEGRYAVLSLQMLRSGDWITPRLNGLLYFEKPALQYWIGAAAFALFGVNEFAARFWPATASLLTVAAVGFTAARLWDGPSGVRALAIAGGCTWIIANGHFLTLDAGLTFFLTLVLCAWLLAERVGLPGDRRRLCIGWAWAAMAGAVLSKGLVGIVIPAASLVLVCLWQRDARMLKGLHWGSGLAIFLVLTAPWFIAVSLRNPSFAPFFFIHEHFARYLTQVHRREGAWWYYLPVLLLGFAPWTGALPWLVRSQAPDSAAGPATHRILLAWCGFVLLFFSLSGSKLPSYILPMFPALALLLAERLRTVRASALRPHLALPALIWLVVAWLATQAHRFVPATSPPEVVKALAWGLVIAAALGLAGCAMAWWYLTRARVTAAVVALALVQLVATQIVGQAHDAYGRMKGSEQIASLLRPMLDSDTPVFSVSSYDQTLPFYLRRNVVLVDYVDEFQLGQQQEPGRSIDTVAAFVAQWQTLPQAAAVMPASLARTLAAQGVPLRVVFEDPRRIVVLRR